MHVVFESNDPEGAELREVAVSRLRFVTRRLGWLVPRATVHLSDVNGPRGGVDKRCQVEIRTSNNGHVVITAMARNWRGALDSALARAAHALVRTWKRSRRQQRSLPRTTRITA